MSSQKSDINSADVAANKMIITIKEVAKNTNTTLNAKRAATEEQSATTENVKEIIDQINIMAEQTTDSAAHTAQTSENLANVATELNELVVNFKV